MSGDHDASVDGDDMDGLVCAICLGGVVDDARLPVRCLTKGPDATRLPRAWSMSCACKAVYCMACLDTWLVGA